MPDLGEGLTGAEIVRWLVEVGDRVAVDQPVVEVETAKAQVEVPTPYAGTVAERFGAPGEEVEVGAPLIRVTAAARPHGAAAVPDPRPGSLEPGPGGGSGSGGGGGPESDPGSGPVLVGYGTRGPAAPARPTPAAARGPAAGKPAAGAPAAGGRAPGAGRADGEPRVAVVSPLVRRLAREAGLDLRHIAGSGPGGLILRADVEAAREAARGAAHEPGRDAARETARGPGRETARAGAPGAAPGAAGEAVRDSRDGETRVPLRGVRGAAAEKLTRAHAEIPAATCWLDADATGLLAARESTGLPLLALLARITLAALARHPELNATVDTAARVLVRHPHVHLGLAAQTERGLLVPVLREADTLSLPRLAEETRRLTRAARGGGLGPAELTGSTFTLNNYGNLGVDGSAPLLNHPEAGMLGVGRIAAKPWAHQGQLALRQVVQLTLTFDHRALDGAQAAAFLRAVAERVEQPLLLLGDF
nr:dihydrolipoamide acetyltransferase family protein [Streptomyces hoynatensis]